MSFTFYTTTEDAWAAMLAAIEGARQSVHLEQYIFNPTPIGMRFIEALRTKAREGVRVKVIADAAGSYALMRSPLAGDMRKDGIDIVFFNPFLFGSRGHHTPWFFRDHCKLLIIDGRRGFTGGVCIDDRMRRWRDTMVEAEGDVVAHMEETFAAMRRLARKKRPRFPRAAFAQTKSGIAYVLNAPLPRRRALYRRLIAAVGDARESVYLTTPYFVPDHRLLRTILNAAGRGVDVRLLVPRSSDQKIVDLAGQSYFTRLLSAGIKIFRYQNTMLHAKTAVVDGAWATVGSLNLDSASLRYNFEANIVSTDRAFAREVEREFKEDLSQSTQLDPEEWNRRPLAQKLLAGLTIPLRPVL